MLLNRALATPHGQSDPGYMCTICPLASPRGEWPKQMYCRRNSVVVCACRNKKKFSLDKGAQ
eukprot:scaffold255099_cov17-Tisochrysis_lutea.AAC.2